MEMLKITGLHKRFGDKEVLRGLDLSVPEHSVFGFIGRNGAGKTTTMKMILGLLKADTGEIRVNGEKAVYGQKDSGIRQAVFQFVKGPGVFKAERADSCSSQRHHGSSASGFLPDVMAESPDIGPFGTGDLKDCFRRKGTASRAFPGA